MMPNDAVEICDEIAAVGDGGGGGMVGGGGGQRKGSLAGLKKGPWTAAEDAILMEYVRKHGEGNWNAVQKNSGLMRCGKSCRLRWANHLRPNLKKGAFTPEEERVIVELHAKYGNKWARMATQLPGRTDNEIKNYWNTRMKRRQRAGLPMYPREFLEQTAAFQMQHQRQEQNLSNHNVPKPSSLFSVFRKAPDYNPSFTLSAHFSSVAGDTLQGHNGHNNALASSGFHATNNRNGVVLSPLSNSPALISTFAPQPQLMVFGQSSAPAAAIDRFNGGGGGENYPNNVISFTSLIMGDYDDRDVDRLESFSFASASELPSLQTPPRSFSSNAATSGRVGGGGVCAAAEGPENANSSSNDHNGEEPAGDGNDEISHADNVLIGGSVVIDDNSGLLDALLQESKSMCRKRKGDDREIGAASSSTAAGEEEAKFTAAVAKRLYNPTTSFYPDSEQLASNACGWDPRDIGREKATVMVEEMSSMDDDDLLSLLTNFPSSIPLPEWYRDHRQCTDNNDNHNANAVELADTVSDGGYAGDHQRCDE